MADTDTDPAPNPAPNPVLAHRAVRAVVDAMAAAGHPINNTLRVLPDSAPTAAAAAAQLSCDVGAIANSLIFELKNPDPAPLLILTSGGHRVDTKAISARLGLSKNAIKRAKPDDVKTWTGQAIGGVAPVGHAQPIRTLVDEDLRTFAEIWVAGGHHMAVYPTTFDTLVEVTHGEVVKVD